MRSVLTPVPDSTALITDKFRGPSGAERVLGSVHVWLAEAINALQDNRDVLTAKVRAGGHGGRGGRAPDVASCTSRTPWSPPGHPGLREPQSESPGPWARGAAALEQAGAAGEAAHGRPGEAGAGAAAGQALRGGGRGAGAAWARAPGGLTAAPQVSEAKAQLRDAQDFWVSLPGTLCSEKTATSTAGDDRCWNGVAKGR